MKLLKKLLDKVTRTESVFDDAVRMHACRVLGEIGDLKVARILADAPDDFSKAMETTLEEAITSINLRKDGA